MHTSLDCLPCLLQQILTTARRATGCEQRQRLIMAEMAQRLSTLDLLASPPENAMGLYGRLGELTGTPDLFAGLKQKSNQLALSQLPRQQQRLEAAADPLLAAIKLAIAGNIIDYGTPHQLGFDEVIESGLHRPLVIDHSQDFRLDLAGAGSILYLADNCGELVFDRLLIERLHRKVILAVKEGPILNDALPEDARVCGLDRCCEIITNGTACPGTPLERCSAAFQEVFRRADLIISKGQGNFETLSPTAAPVYFLLTVKCRVVAAHLEELTGIRVSLGESVLLNSRRARPPGPSSPPS